VALHIQQFAQFGPIILNQPQSQAAVSGGSVLFGLTALSDPPPNYQWLFNGLPLPGRTNALLQLNNLNLNQSGAYSVRVVNQYGTNYSLAAMLRVEKAFSPSF